MKNNKKEFTNRAEFSDFIINQTGKYQKKYGFGIGNSHTASDTHNNESDAFKHVFFQAYLAYKDNRLESWAAGYYHEYVEGRKQGQPKGELEMDLWNNKIGRDIGAEVKSGTRGKKLSNDQVYNLIAEKIVKSMRRGELITKPGQKAKAIRNYGKEKAFEMETGGAAPIKETKSIRETLIAHREEKLAYYTARLTEDPEKIKEREAKHTSLEDLKKPQTDRINTVHKKIQEYEEKLKKKKLEKKNTQKQSKSKNSANGSGDGRWITMNGAHIHLD